MRKLLGSMFVIVPMLMALYFSGGWMAIGSVLVVLAFLGLIVFGVFLLIVD